MKTSKNLILLFSFAYFVSFQSALAQSIDQKFSKLSYEEQSEIYTSSPIEVISFKEWIANSQDKELGLELIKTKAQYVFDIWGDTILGGDVVEVPWPWWISQKSVYLYNGKAVGVSAVSNSRAVYVGDSYCDWDYHIQRGKWNPECLNKNLGTIRQKFVVNFSGRMIYTGEHEAFYFDDITRGTY